MIIKASEQHIASILIPEDGEIMYHRNIGTYLSKCKTPQFKHHNIKPMTHFMHENLPKYTRKICA
jgi:hypothetical protein